MDGRWALAALSSPSPFFMLLPTGAGEPKRLTMESVRPEQAAAWLPDGRILFAGNEANRGVRLFVQSVAGGKPRPITPEGIGTAFPGFAVSPDGKSVAAIGSDRRGMLFRIDGGGVSRPIPGIVDGEFPLRFAEDGRSLFVWKRELPARVYRVDLETGNRELWKELMPVDPGGVERISNVVVTPDAKSYAYTYSRLLSDLFVVEGLE
jgi:Tol biopolymer transport system component